MTRSGSIAATLMLMMSPQPGWAQSATEAAKADGKAFGRDKAATAQGTATTVPDASRIPNFGGTPSHSGYFDDPKTIEGAAASAATGHDGYRAMRSSMNNRARFAPVDLDATIARSKAISGDPLSFTSGMAVGGTQGRCVPLPPAAGSAGRYFATCNSGYTATTERRACTIPLDVTVTETLRYRYYAEVPLHSGIAPALAEFSGAIVAGTCTNMGTIADPCQVPRVYGFRPSGSCRQYRFDVVECQSALSGLSGINVLSTGAPWFASVATRSAITARNEAACAPLAGDTNCALEAESCTDSDPVTRIVDGLSVTQPCWAWQRSYQCNALTAAEDCSALASTPGCNFVREECLAGEPCRTWERVYDCPVPDLAPSSNQFICDGDIYCIDGSCETIKREADDEFKDAVVALNAMAQARREFDPDSLTLFKGERETCSSKVFGVLNCCKGKGFPLIPGIGLLVALGCNPQEVLLHQRDAQGLCAYVGTYCSSDVLGICVTKKKVYCCFESKLSRILQEQGRQQLDKPWAKPKAEKCAGFTIDEFSRLDLSAMDFSEVYAEFTEAARLPDELEAAENIQRKIEDFYAAHRN